MSQYPRVDDLLLFLLIHQSTLIFLVRGGCLWTIHASKASGTQSLIYYLKNGTLNLNNDEFYKMYKMLNKQLGRLARKYGVKEIYSKKRYELIWSILEKKKEEDKKATVDG